MSKMSCDKMYTCQNGIS